LLVSVRNPSGSLGASDMHAQLIDGGGARGLSQLEIMGHIMHRLQCDRYPDDPDKIILPCEHFDLIGGTGTGG
jgi:patatin-like phospholipase/acyl hydrolase